MIRRHMEIIQTRSMVVLKQNYFHKILGLDQSKYIREYILSAES